METTSRRETLHTVIALKATFAQYTIGMSLLTLTENDPYTDMV